MHYTLSKELIGHDGCARCVCILKDNRIATGGLDNRVIIWNYVDCTWVQELQLLHHKRYVLAIEPSNFQLDSKSHDVRFYSGGLDEIIYYSSANDGKIFASYKGHKSAICNIKELSELKILISGSWDGTARIWDLNSSVCKFVLDGHQYAVALSNIIQTNNGEYFFLTGSQNKSLSMWKIPEVKLIKTINDSHDDIIRSIGISKDNFEKETLVAITVSNDCAIKIWQLFLESGSENCILKNTKKHHSSFIFDIKFSDYHNDRFFTVSDDCSIAIWKLAKNFEILLLQNITLTTTIWSLAEINGTDSVITVSEDGICRVWVTSNDNSELPKLPVLTKLETSESNKYVLSDDLQNDQEGGVKILNEIPEITLLNSTVASKIGTIQIFKEVNVLKAFEWANDCWNFLGTISGIKNQAKVKYLGDKYFNCGLYDFVVKVETEVECNNCKIPFNFGDSAIESAEKFCLRERICRKYCRAICNSIINGIYIDNNNAISTFNELFEPCFEFKLFKKLNIDSLISSFRKEKRSYLEHFNNNDQVKVANTHFILDSEIEYLNDFFLRLKNNTCNGTSSINSLQIKPIEIDIIYKKLSNFLGVNFLSVAIIDLWRILALHTQSSDIHKKTDQGWWLLALVLNIVDFISFDYRKNPLICENNEFRSSLFLICIRFLCNLFKNPTNREVMLSKMQEILLKIDKPINILTDINFQLSLKENTNKNVVTACLALMFNYIVALNNKNCGFVNLRNLIILFVCKLIPLLGCDEFVKHLEEILHYQLLIFTNNYYHVIRHECYDDIYILEDEYIRTITDLIMKNYKNSFNPSKTLYYQLLTSINIIKNMRNC